MPWVGTRRVRRLGGTFGDNDVPLQKLRFGSHGGKYYEEAAGGKRQGVLESILNRTNDELIDDGIVIGGDLDSTCRGIDKWMGLGVDQLLFMVQAGETSHEDTMRALGRVREQGAAEISRD